MIMMAHFDSLIVIQYVLPKHSLEPAMPQVSLRPEIKFAEIYSSSKN